MSENKTAIERIPEQVRKVFEDNDIEIIKGWEANKELNYEIVPRAIVAGEKCYVLTIREGLKWFVEEWLNTFSLFCCELSGEEQAYFLSTLDAFEDLKAVNDTVLRRIPTAVKLAIERNELRILFIGEMEDDYYTITVSGYNPATLNSEFHRLVIKQDDIEDYWSWAHAFCEIWTSWKPQEGDNDIYKDDVLEQVNNDLHFLESLTHHGLLI